MITLLGFWDIQLHDVVKSKKLLGRPVDEFWEDVQNGLPSLSGSRHPVGGGVRAADDGSENIITGEAES